MRPIPASKHDDIIHELNAISDHLDITPFAFKLNRYKNDAQKIIKNDPEIAYIILGIIACIENDIERMHKYHKIAIKFSGDSTYSLSQYGLSLLAQDLLGDAYNYTYRAYEKTPEDQPILNRLMHISYIMGRDDKYHEFKTKMKKLKFDFQDPDQFPEDDKEFLSNIIPKVDKLMKKNPHMIVKPDSDFIELVEDLIEGVDIS